MPAPMTSEGRAFARGIAGGLPILAAALVLGAAGAAILPEGTVRDAAWAALAAGCAVLIGIGVLRARAHRGDREEGQAAIRAIAADPAPSVLTDGAGLVIGSNAPGMAVLDGRAPDGTPLAGALAARLADPEGTVRSLLGRVAEDGAGAMPATRAGGLGLAAHRAGPGLVLWRLTDSARDASVDGGLPMLTATAAGTILFMNEPLRRLAGHRPRTLEELFGPDAAAPRLRGEDGPVDVELRELDGGGGRREIYVLPPSQHAAPGTDDLFDALPVGLLRIGEGGAVIAGNRLARDLTGSDLPDGIALDDLVEGLGRSIDGWVADGLAGMGLGHPETLRARRRTVETHLQVTLGRMVSPDGPSLVAVLNDATELKTLEAQFVQSQKMQAIGQLAGGVAHDFNNLLTAISGHCDLLMLRHDKDDSDFADLSQISQNANRAAALVGQLLAFSRKQTQQLETLDLRETLADLGHLLNRLVGEKVSLQLHHDPALSPMRGDRRQLEQVILNLVVNARDALGEDGGEVGIVTSNCRLAAPLERDSVEVPAGRYVKVQVRDAGMGIEPSQVPKIFEPFFTTKRTGEGTGLGLSTAYGIVKQTGGFIFVDSTLGVGTVFTLYFPAAHAAAAPVQVAKAAPARPAAVEEGPQGVVLLVEDEAPVRAFASRALRLHGYTVIEAEDAEAALEIADDREIEIDIFVTDVIMPGMDGPTWVRRALTDRPGTPVIFVSGYAEDALDGASETIPGSMFLPKPFSLSALSKTVGDALHARG